MTSSNISAVVITGEASESDDDIPVSSTLSNNRGKVPLSVTATVIPGEAAESDDEVTSIPVMSLATPLQVEGNVKAEVKSPTVPRSSQNTKYNSLLHKKLRETNSSINDRLDGFIKHQFESSTKSLRTTAQQLAASQLIIQEVSHTTRLLTNDLFQLEDKVDIVTACTILPDILLPAS